tara:strand:+ start:1163 stop:2815 length:1653 start_codon:yes stop_codon:yes gene_type:complete
MIRKYLRKNKNDENSENEDLEDSDDTKNSENEDFEDSDDSENSDYDEYIPSENEEESDDGEYINYNKKKKDAIIINQDDDELNLEQEYNINDINKLSEKILKNNVILVLNNNKNFINYSENEEEQETEDEINNKDDTQNIEDKNKRRKYNDVLVKYNKDEKNYFNNLTDEEKDRIYNLEKSLNKNKNNDEIPTRFKLLEYDINNIVKKSIIYNIEQLNCMCKSTSEYFKLHNWINTLSKIPIGKYNKLDITLDDNVSTYLENIKMNIDNNIYGHEETKHQIIRILAQWISNPEKTGYVIGIKGPPGVGKTKLIKECICKAMNFPLAFISLGGIDDSSYLSGFNYTYEGSTYGKILECLIKSEVMNPVFLFDELDKVSATLKGDEIINTLIHLTDPVQNDRYTDKFFQEIDLDLSKSIIIFTYNNENNINPILKDRMITINVNGYTSKEKFQIAKNFLVDELLPKYNMKKGDIIFEDKLLEHIISQTSIQEDGVRNLKREINNIISWINMMKYIKTDNIVITLPFVANIDYYNKYCRKIIKNTNESMNMYL